MKIKRIALITGATSGIGKATAELFAKNGLDLILTGRRVQILNTFSKELKTKYPIQVLPLSFDIRERDQVKKIINQLEPAWKKIEILVNNAGLASGLSHIQDGDIDDWEKMIDTNIKGLLYISRAIMPLMIANKKGHIINIASTAGKEVYENGNVYCATKHAVDAISKAMRVDMLKEGIKVTSINPGLVETEFSIVRFHGDKEKAKIPYTGLKPLQGEDIANVIWFAINLPAHVNINDLVLTATAQANSFYIKREED